MTTGETPPGTPTPGSWTALVALGALASLWAVFLWGELILARSGGTPFCTASGSEGCAALWDSPFATSVHRVTGLPIAGWGLAWGLAAFALPLVGLWRKAEGTPLPAIVTATRLVAGAGTAAVLALAAVSASEQVFCIGCFGFYALVAGYSGVALFGWTAAGLPDVGRGTALAASALGLAYVSLLLPGQRTPLRTGDAARAAVSAAGVTPPGPEAGHHSQALGALISSLDAGMKQTLADSLDVYRHSVAGPMPAARFLVGPAEAPVRITEFTDILCPHCAALERDLDAIRRSAPDGSFNVEPRQFPLDSECNPLVTRTGSPVRCLAAKARICMEGVPGFVPLTEALFENQNGLTVDQVFAMADPYRKRPDLEACIHSSETAGKLADDIRYAATLHADGTPIVLVNGRQGRSFGPFLYAMILTRGEAADPAFEPLPPPNPDAHPH